MDGPAAPDEPGTDIDRATARRRVLKTDGLAGLGVLVVGLIEGGRLLLDPFPLAITALFVAATALSLYAVEHDSIPGVYPEVVALAALLGLGVFGASLVVVVPRSVALVAAAALVGFGAGIICYRAVFGLVYSIPETRLQRAG
jgi:drug/metabolite transporter (DMT)-like permease